MFAFPPTRPLVRGVVMGENVSQATAACPSFTALADSGACVLVPDDGFVAITDTDARNLTQPISDSESRPKVHINESSVRGLSRMC
jgi:hypothetical protein